MKTYQKVLCCVLAICICFMCWARPAAHAEALTITGAAVMSIAVVACIVIMVMSSMDVIDALKDMAASKSMLPSQLVQQYIILFLSKTAVSVGQLLNTFKDGVRYKSDGTIYLNETVSVWIQEFITWLWSPFGGNMSDYNTGGGASVQQQPLNVNGVSVAFAGPIYVSGMATITRTEGNITYKTEIFSNSLVRFAIFEWGTTTAQTIAASSGQFTVTETLYVDGNIDHQNTTNATLNSSVNNYPVYMYQYTNTHPANDTRIYDPFLSSYNVTNFINNNRALTIGILLAYGDLTLDGDVNVGVLDLPEGTDTNVLEPQDTLVLPAPIGLDIEEYLTGTVDVLLEGTGEFTGTDDQTVTVEGTETAVPVDQTTYGTLTGTETISITTTLTGTESLSIDLTDFFPFCIPFDIYKLLSLLSSTRQAPYLEWRFYIPNVCDETIVLDFSVFDPLAAILRHLELFAFAVGLAAATKKLIQGGD